MRTVFTPIVKSVTRREFYAAISVHVNGACYSNKVGTDQSKGN